MREREREREIERELVLLKETTDAPDTITVNSTKEHRREGRRCNI